jgi:hypothetical protein
MQRRSAGKPSQGNPASPKVFSSSAAAAESRLPGPDITLPMAQMWVRPKQGILLTSQSISDVNIGRYHSSSEK